MITEIDKLVKYMIKNEILTFDMYDEKVKRSCKNYLIMLQLNNDEITTKVDELLYSFNMLKDLNDLKDLKNKVINSLDEFDIADCDNYYTAATHYKLSEEFIETYSDKLNWVTISEYQKLSEEFIEKHSDKLDWQRISLYQKLSEDFIRKHKDKVIWKNIIKSQILHEYFLREVSKEENVRWSIFYANDYFTRDIILSEEFKAYDSNTKLEKLIFKYYDRHHKQMTHKERLDDMECYAKEYDLEFDGKYLYAYREHDRWGRGKYSIQHVYYPYKYYRDWHCDMDKYNLASFGLGIFPKGNVKVKVSVDDWGLYLKNSHDGKCRVWGFEVLEENHL